MSNLFDDFARLLAQPAPRRGALRFAGQAFAASILGIVWDGRLAAQAGSCGAVTSAAVTYNDAGCSEGVPTQCLTNGADALVRNVSCPGNCPSGTSSTPICVCVNRFQATAKSMVTCCATARCGSSCPTFSSDCFNCGVCGNTCSGGQCCVNGACSSSVGGCLNVCR